MLSVYPYKQTTIIHHETSSDGYIHTVTQCNKIDICWRNSLPLASCRRYSINHHWPIAQSLSSTCMAKEPEYDVVDSLAVSAALANSEIKTTTHQIGARKSFSHANTRGDVFLITAVGPIKLQNDLSRLL